MKRPLPILTLILVLAAAPALAQQTLRLTEGDGEAIRLDRPAASVFVGDPSVADIQAVSDETILVTGLSPGMTNVLALDFDDRQIAQYRIVVTADDSAARGLLGGNTGVQSSGSTGVVVGNAGSVAEALATLDATRGLAGEGRGAVNRTGLTAPVQVSLRVRFAEVSRDDLFQLGFDFSGVSADGSRAVRVATGGGIASGFVDGLVGKGSSFARAGLGGTLGNADLDIVLDALERVGVVQILSEPTLTTVSGRRAQFRAGGEFAFPVNQGDGVITAEYKQTGVSLDFLPTVLPGNRIAVEVNPEVSFIDPEQGVQIAGFSAPSLSVRSAQTTVEVTSGQTFAIAGLYERQASDRDTGVPGLRRAPVVGGLFNNRSQRRTERELVIFITPLIVDASDVSAVAAAPRDVSQSVGFIVK